MIDEGAPHMLSVAMLSRWHVHANDYARQANNHPDIRIAAVWDEDPARGRAWAEELGVTFYQDLAALLSDADIDGVIVDTPTNMHRDVIIQAAKSGKHIFSEKVLGLSVEECDDIFAAVDASGVELMLSLPRLSHPYYLFAQRVVDSGSLGQITMIRCRLAHNGAVPGKDRPHGWLPEHFFDREACGGGALIDLGAHTIYLTNRLGGAVNAVTARMTSTLGRAVDDNSVVIVEYEQGALGVLETGFVSSGSPFQLQVYGTKGMLSVEDESVRMKVGDAWETPELPSAIASPLEQWTDAILRRVPATISRADMRRLTEINQAAAVSHAEGRRVPLDARQ